MIDHFDLIAIPKGSAPGGPVQASDGHWYLVIPATLDLSDAVQLIQAQRAGRPVTTHERLVLAEELSK